MNKKYEYGGLIYCEDLIESEFSELEVDENE